MAKFVPKTPKGMRDFGPGQAAFRDQVMDKMRTVFRRHGAQAIDLPVCELKETLMHKYGEEAKLIYELKDEGGELLALRYDLTVPFARYLAQNKINAMKRYQIGKVYRRENPSANQGRYREFYQCDIDIAGSSDEMIPDSECLRIVAEILKELDITNYTFKVNHRQLLDGVFKLCDVPPEKFRTICSAIDKLDKMSWEDVKREMVVEKNLPEESADRIHKFVTKKGRLELLDDLLEGELASVESAKKALESMKLFFEYCEALEIDDHISFDLSLARGLDYYTGIIFEATLADGKVQLGSIAAGGRYDGLIGSMSDSKNWEVPCVGISIGMERIFDYLERPKKGESKKETEQRRLAEQKALYPTQVFICSAGKENMVKERVRLAMLLWNAGINVEHPNREKPNLMKQFNSAESKGIPYCVVIGEDEIKKRVVKLRDMSTRAETEVARSELVNVLKQRIAEKSEVTKPEIACDKPEVTSDNKAGD